MGGKGMTQRMGSDIGWQIQLQQAPFEQALDAAGCKSTTTIVEKQSVFIPHRALFKIKLKSMTGSPPNRKNTLLVPLPHHPDLALFQIDGIKIQARSFADPQTTGIEEFTDGQIADQLRITVDRGIKQSTGLLSTEHPGQITLAPWRHDRSKGRRVNHPLALEITIKCFK